ncbi:MAG: hypothetical protein RIT27_350 [Pseudomonadota bacterium]
MKHYFMAAAVLISSQIAFAAEEPKFTDPINLSSLTSGSSAGNGLIVRQFDNGGNFLSAKEKSSGSLKVPINLSGKFEVQIAVFPGTFGNGIFVHLTAADDSKISIETQRAWVGFTGKYAGVFKQATYNPEGWSDTGWNVLHLLVDAGVAKLYINDIFLDKINLNSPNATFTNLLIPTITDKDGIAGIGVKQLSGTTTGGTTTGGTTTGNNCSSPVTLDANLNMKIPNATYQPALGNPMNLWANFQFVPSSDGSMTWKLSNYGVNP